MTDDVLIPVVESAPQLPEDDLVVLEKAVYDLENPGLIARMAAIVGTPVEIVFEALPEKVTLRIDQVVQSSLRGALRMAVATLGRRKRRPHLGLHRLMAAATGAGGGAFGLPALALELPMTTTLMLRSIADIARSEGEDLDRLETRLACLEVFALGGQSGDQAADSGYFAVRAALGKAVSEAAAYAVRRGVIEESAPAIIRLLAQIASRFNTVVAEKVIAQGVPVVGALGGTVVNSLFMGHFQRVARAHFAIRRLERLHTPETVRQIYDGLAADLRSRS